MAGGRFCLLWLVVRDLLQLSLVLERCIVSFIGLTQVSMSRVCPGPFGLADGSLCC